MKMEKGSLLFQISKIFFRFCVNDKMVSVTGKYFRLIKTFQGMTKGSTIILPFIVVNFAFTTTR